MNWQGFGDLRWLGDDSAPTAVVMRRLGRWRWQVGGLRDLARRRIGYAATLEAAVAEAEAALAVNAAMTRPTVRAALVDIDR